MGSAPAHVIVIACSATKRPGAAHMPAIDRYDGPMWRSLRARLAELPAAQAAWEARDLEIYVLSAKFGLVSADVPMPDYDQRLTEARARDLLHSPAFDLQMLRHLVNDAKAVLFAGGVLYRNTMWKASGADFANIMKITETDGRGIGSHRAELGEWMQQRFAPVPELAA